MAFKPGDPVIIRFTTRNTSGILINADSLPTGSVVRNYFSSGSFLSTIDSTTVTITNQAAGEYSAQFTIPSGYTIGDIVQLRIAATVAAISDIAYFSTGKLDEYRLADVFDGSGHVAIQVGTGAGQIALNGGNVPIDMSVAISTTPTAGTLGFAFTVLSKIATRYGQALDGATNTIQLDAGASAVDNVYQGFRIYLLAGTGAGQSRTITSYVGFNKQATPHKSWDIVPDSTTFFLLFPSPVADIWMWSGSLVNALISGRVDVNVGVLASAAIQSIWDALTSALTTAGSIGALFVANINATISSRSTLAGSDITSALNAQGLTTTNAGYLANLSAGPVATAAALLNIQNNSFISTNIPPFIEGPDTASETLLIAAIFADDTGAAVDIDASGSPTTIMVNDAGTSLASRLSSWAHPTTGKYTATYTNSAGDALERIHWELTATVNSKLRRYVATTQIVDMTTQAFTSADRTNLTNLVTRLGSPAGASVAADVAAVKSDTGSTLTDASTLLSRLGSPVGATISADIATVGTTATSVNTKLGSPAGASIASDIAAVKSDTGSIAATVWNALLSALTTAGSIGKSLAAFIAALGSDSRPKVSADAHTSGETVAAVAGSVGSVSSPVATTSDGIIDTMSADLGGIASSASSAATLAGEAKTSADAATTAATAADTAAAGALTAINALSSAYIAPNNAGITAATTAATGAKTSADAAAAAATAAQIAAEAADTAATNVLSAAESAATAATAAQTAAEASETAASSANTTATAIQILLEGIDLGSGAVATTFHIEDTNAVAVIGATITLLGIGSAVTNGSGNFVAMLDPGTYSVRVAGGRILFPETSVTVVADTPQTVTIQATSAISPPDPPDDPTTCIVYVDTIDKSQSWTGTLEITALPSLDTSSTRWIGQGCVQQSEADATGRITFAPVPRLSTIKVRVKNASLNSTNTVPDAATYAVLTP